MSGKCILYRIDGTLEDCIKEKCGVCNVSQIWYHDDIILFNGSPTVPLYQLGPSVAKLLALWNSGNLHSHILVYIGICSFPNWPKAGPTSHYFVVFIFFLIFYSPFEVFYLFYLLQDILLHSKPTLGRS